jgi:hypothetical protein
VSHGVSDTVSRSVNPPDPPDLPEPPADPVINALVLAIRKDWTRIDAAWDRTRTPRRIHLRRDAALDAHDGFLRAALQEARRRGFLHVLIYALIREDLLTDDDVRRISSLPGGPTWELQAFQNGAYRPVNALLYGKDLLAAAEHVCRIDIDGRHVGTGVQVSPVLVATAAHVIDPLVRRKSDGSADLDADGWLQAAEDSLGKLVLTFCYAEDYLDDESPDTYRNPGEVVPLYYDWLAWGSGRAVSDDPRAGFDVASIDGIAIPAGPWDMAFIRLAEPRQKPRPTRLLAEEPPMDPIQIGILHHPNAGIPSGQPLLISIGQLSRQIGTPPVRCLHDASTLRGSSGAPVFDSKWRVVAVHQGGLAPVWDDTTWGGGHNRAVPAARWRERLEITERSIGDQAPYLKKLTTSTDLTPCPYPVIGRRETQRRVWRAMRKEATAQDRLLIVRGEPGTGRRFTKRLVKQMVSSTDGVVAVLDMANTLDDSVAGFVERIAGALSVQPRLPDAAPLTTEQRIIRDDLVPSLAQELEVLAGGQDAAGDGPESERAVWLVLEGFGDMSTGIPATVTDVIGNLIKRLPDFPWLRLVLVGWTLTPEDYEQSVEELRRPTADDVVWHLCPPGDVPTIKMVNAIRSHFAFMVEGQDVSYPVVQQIALDMAEMLRRRLELGGGA